ncbi:MAG: hypothetical protein ABJB49_05340 [Nitrospirota bacterium]
MATHIGPGGMIARFTGKIFVALGFIMGIYGLTEAQPAVLQAGLGLLVAGVLASVYGLYRMLPKS